MSSVYQPIHRETSRFCESPGTLGSLHTSHTEHWGGEILSINVFKGDVFSHGLPERCVGGEIRAQKWRCCMDDFGTSRETLCHGKSSVPIVIIPCPCVYGVHVLGRHAGMVTIGTELLPLPSAEKDNNVRALRIPAGLSTFSWQEYQAIQSKRKGYMAARLFCRAWVSAPATAHPGK